MIFLRALSCLVLVMAGASSGAVLGSWTKSRRPARAPSPGFLDLVVIVLCWAGALLTARWGFRTLLAFGLWIAIGLIAMFAIHRVRKRAHDEESASRAPYRQSKSNPDYISTRPAGEAHGARATWRSFAGAVGGFQSRIILGALYFTVLAPFGIFVGRLGDLLRVKARSGGSFWQPRDSDGQTLVDARRQY